MTVYGIDCGTTYSRIAKLNCFGDPEIIQDVAEASDSLASAIYFSEDGEVIVGETAKEMGIDDPSRLCLYFRSRIGGDVARLEGRMGSESYIIDGTPYDPDELSSVIFKIIVRYSKLSGEDVRDVVLTIPAYFNLSQKEGLLTAGKLAGLNVLGMINEPTAEVLNYAHKHPEDEGTILVYDLGGYTFNVTLVNLTSHNGVPDAEILAAGGDKSLGGIDWDEKVYEILFEKFCDESGYTREDIPEETDREIHYHAERVKKELTGRTSFSLRIDCDGYIYKPKITREEFDSRCADLLEKTRSLIVDILHDAGLKKDNIHAVLLAGGSSNMVMVREMLKNEFGEEKIIFDKPELSAAFGAALVGKNIDYSN